jgi:hypothetical protein
MAEGSWFVYRSPYEGPSGRRVRRLPDASPLAWFQRMWQTTADEESFDRDTDAYDWVDANLEADLGGRVYGLNSIFCSVDDGDRTPADADRASLRADRRGSFPASSWQELEGLLRRHLYVEGDPSDQIRVDEHSVRAATDDDEVDLAYYFLDDALAASDQATYLMLEDWRLPTTPGTDGHAFNEPAGVQRLTAGHGGTGATYVVALSPGDLFDRRNLVPPSALVGVRLPELASRLRSVRPGDADPGWPYSLLTLRSLVAPADWRIGPSLRRYTRSVGRLHHNDETIKRVWRSATEDHATASAALEALLQRPPSGRRNSWTEPDTTPSRVNDTKHVAQALVHVHELFGYEQWYLFDDVWAAGHPELASSLLRYASSWDPFETTEGAPQNA